jgi:SAM-dependent methyltransferase
MSGDAALREDVATSWQASRGNRAVRAYSDLVNRSLLDGWLPELVDSVLKTDLFDEIAGEGLVGSLAARAGRVVGIDVSPWVVRKAVSRNPGLEGVVADVHALPFEPTSFDLVVSNSTLDHFESRDEIDHALDELARVLRPGGTLVVTLDNAANTMPPTR